MNTEIDLSKLDQKCKDVLVHLQFCPTCREILNRLYTRHIKSEAGKAVNPIEKQARLEKMWAARSAKAHKGERGEKNRNMWEPTNKRTHGWRDKK